MNQSSCFFMESAKVPLLVVTRWCFIFLLTLVLSLKRFPWVEKQYREETKTRSNRTVQVKNPLLHIVRAASPVTVLSQAAGPTITLVIYFLFFNMFALLSPYNPLFSLALIKIVLRWLLFLSFPQGTKCIDWEIRSSSM